MIGLDQKKTSRFKTENIIQRTFGGRFSFWESIRSAGNGVGNLQYISGLEDEGIIITNKFYKCNLERLKKGVALYVFNDDVNAIFLLTYNEILSVNLSKKPDIVDPAKFSYFRWMMNRRFDYFKCKFMLLEPEIIEEQKAILTIQLIDGSELKFSNRSWTPRKLSQFFNQEVWKGKYMEDIQHSITLSKI